MNQRDAKSKVPHCVILKSGCCSITSLRRTAQPSHSLGIKPNFSCMRKFHTKFLPPKVLVDLTSLFKSLPRKTTEIEHSFHNSVFIRS
jgi:hypothetical protein